VIICEPIASGVEHVPINTQLLANVIKGNECSIKLFCEATHWERLKETLSAGELSRVSYYESPSWKAKRRKIDWFRQFQFLRSINKLSEKNEEWLFLGVNRPIYLWLCLFFRVRKKTIIFHSILADIDGWQSRNPFLRLVSLKVMLESFAKHSPEIVVLEEYIKRELISIIPALKNRVLVIPHPLPADQFRNFKKHEDVNVYDIGFPGIFSYDKGADLYRKICMAGDFRSINYHVIGRNATNNEVAVLRRYLKSGPYDASLSREIYVQNVNKCDYLFFSQNESHYKLTASGVFLDAIYFEKPIIARKTPNLEALTNGLWNIGYFYESEEQLKSILHEIDSHSPGLRDDYAMFIEALCKLKKDRELEFRRSVNLYLCSSEAAS